MKIPYIDKNQFMIMLPNIIAFYSCFQKKSSDASLKESGSLEACCSGLDFIYAGLTDCTDLDYIHLSTGHEDIYFVSNGKLQWSMERRPSPGIRAYGACTDY